MPPHCWHTVAVLALSLAAVSSSDATGTDHLATAQRPAPQWAYNASRLNVGWFGSNVSGFENAAQLAMIARYDLAIFGWQAFLDQTNYTREAEQLVLQARLLPAVKSFVHHLHVFPL
jgi:hypothetical protein